ncbi:hypothetical protein V8F33_004251 [Rhypophila sp. PSN 637]
MLSTSLTNSFLWSLELNFVICSLGPAGASKFRSLTGLLGPDLTERAPYWHSQGEKGDIVGCHDNLGEQLTCSFNLHPRSSLQFVSALWGLVSQVANSNMHRLGCRRHRGE